MSKKYVNKIRYCSYSTLFSCTGDINLRLTNRACFGELLSYRLKVQKEHYEIFLIRDSSYIIDQHRNNLCLLNAKELRKHLWLVRRLFGFSYNVEDSQYNNLPAYKITLDVDAPYFYHKYLLTWLRYTYESPYNLILNDALRLKHQCLPKESITNLFVLVANSYGHMPDYYGEGHSISRKNSAFLKEYELKARINEIASSKDMYRMTVNWIYPLRHDNYKINDSEQGIYLDYWLDQEAFESRKECYLSNYKLMTKK